MSARVLLLLALFLPLVSAAAATTGPVHPDVALSHASIRASDDSVVTQTVAGRTYWFEAWVENRGTTAVAAASVSFVLDGALRGVASIAALEPGERVVVTSEPWEAVPGTHALDIQAIAAGDASPMNNGAAVSFATSDGLLQIEAPVRDAQIRPYETIVRDVRISNQASEGRHVRLERSGASTGWIASVDEIDVDLAPGASVVVHFTVLARPGGLPLNAVLRAVSDGPFVEAASVVLTTRLGV